MDHFWLGEQFPDLALDLDFAFRTIGRDDLAGSVWVADIQGLCPCESESCGTFYTLPDYVRSEREEIICGLLVDVKGFISVGVVDDQLASVEIIGRPDICRQLVKLFSYGWSEE